MEKKIIMALVFCAGIKNRCRKVDRHMFDLGEFDAEGFDQAEVERKAIEVVTSSMKSLQGKVVLSLQPATKKDEGMFVSRQFQILTDTKVDLTSRFVLPAQTA
jgi:hypothetical protein